MKEHGRKRRKRVRESDLYLGFLGLIALVLMILAACGVALQIQGAAWMLLVYGLLLAGLLGIRLILK